jgi:aminopeptidase N
MSNKPQTIYLKDYKPPVFLAPKIDLLFQLFDQETFLTATTSYERNPKSEDPSSDLFLNGEKLELIEIMRNEVPLDPKDYELQDKGLLLKNCPDSFKLTTRVRLEPHKNKAFSGLYKTQSVFCTQMEAQGFRKTTFFMDRPDVLSQYKTTIEADQGNFPVLLSNGNLILSQTLDSGRHQAVWEDPFLKPCYLFALVAGDLDWIEDSYLTRSKKRVDLKIYVNKGQQDRARFAMDSLKQSMKWDEDTYRLEYDLDIYNIVAVDDFNMGAMENKGLNIFNSKYVLASPKTATDDEYQAIQRVIGHEYFHNWSGNRVTCRDWFQLSLKEGLTVFRDQEFSSDLNSRAVKRIEDVVALRSRQFPEDSGPMAHPVRPSSYIAIDNFYTVTVYEKGAEVIRMLQTLLGADMFKRGVAKYFELYDGQAVTTDDWVYAMELVSGKDLSQFKLWYDQAGTPQVSVSHTYNPEQQSLEITLEQKTLDPITNKENQAYLMPILVGLINEQGAPVEFSYEGKENLKQVCLELKESKQTFHLQNIYTAPVVSLNREFSAPIHLNYEQSDSELYLLMTKDTDSFNRWESAQKIYRQVLIKGYQNILSGAEMEVPSDLVDSFAQLIRQAPEDPALCAQVIQLPQMQYLGQFLQDIEPQALEQAYTQLRQTIAKELHTTLWQAYSHLNDKKLGHSPQDIALRSFKNQLLSYLWRHQEEEGAPVFFAQFENSQNMTDKMAALFRLSVHGGATYEKAMSQFHDEWKADRLVMNKWFSVSARCQSDQSFEQIKQRTQSPAYDSSNPNNVFSLLYTFAQYNWGGFHQEDGKTYDWFAERVIEVDKANPQVSSRLGTCFNNWKKFAPKYQTQMQKALEKIQQSSPSDNLFEIVNRALDN